MTGGAWRWLLPTILALLVSLAAPAAARGTIPDGVQEISAAQLPAEARQTIAWSDRLKDTGCAVVFVDERLSSFDAEQQLVDRKRAGEKITRQSKKEILDALVATKLLQEFLDEKLVSIDPAANPPR